MFLLRLQTMCLFLATWKIHLNDFLFWSHIFSKLLNFRHMSSAVIMMIRQHKVVLAFVSKCNKNASILLCFLNVIRLNRIHLYSVEC